MTIANFYLKSECRAIRNKTHVRKLINHHLSLGQHRNHLLIVFGLHTALRISDLLPICWGDVYDFKANKPRKYLTITEQKTGKTKSIALNNKIITALKLCASTAKPNQYIFENVRTGKPITRTQARRIICAAGEAVSLPWKISCHSLHKTFGYHAWRSGVSPAIIMEIYNHSNLGVTRRYLDVTQDDMNMVYMELTF